MNRYIFFTVLIAMTATCTFAQPAGWSAEAVRNYWNVCKPKPVKQTYVTAPSVKAPFSAGQLHSDYLNNGLNMLKFIRYVAQLSKTLELDNTMNVNCQAGALVMAVNNVLSHSPSQPAGMSADLYSKGKKGCGEANIFASSANSIALEDAVRSWAHDSDPVNIKDLGHRRWLLNPVMEKTGFGCVTNPGKGTFATVYAFDNSKGSNYAFDRVLWPSLGSFPSDLFEGNQAWSIILNNTKYKANDNMEVTLTCLTNSKKWVFSSKMAGNNPNGKYFNVSTAGYGSGFCIIFRPDGVTSYETDKYKVEVTGLRDTKNVALPKMEYTVTFFKL
jgi:uncharacterized protein YkwD